MRYGLMFLMVLGGMLLAFQVPVNVRLRESLNSPVLSAATSFFVGAVVLLLIVATGALGGSGNGLEGFRSAPLWSFLGGICGASYVLFSILTLPRVGAAVTISCAILGQQIAALLVDSFGLFGAPRLPFTAARIAGVLLLVSGVFLLQRK